MLASLDMCHECSCDADGFRPQVLSYSGCCALTDSTKVPSFLQWNLAGAAGDFFDAREEAVMNETSDSITSMNGPGVTGMDDNVVRRVAQKAHETVDKLEQTVSTGSERMMTMQEEYGSYAREQIRMRPLSTVAGAFVVGLLLGKILL
jgi:ElaB/YqjD/DUF883 family membrane-anchored ribosome-binding protein